MQCLEQSILTLPQPGTKILQCLEQSITLPEIKQNTAAIPRTNHNNFYENISFLHICPSLRSDIDANDHLHKEGGKMLKALPSFMACLINSFDYDCVILCRCYKHKHLHRFISTYKHSVQKNGLGVNLMRLKDNFCCLHL